MRHYWATKLMKMHRFTRALSLLLDIHHRGGSRISGKGVNMYIGVGVCFADFISFFLNIPFWRSSLIRGLPCLLFWQVFCVFHPWKPTFYLRTEREKCSKFSNIDRYYQNFMGCPNCISILMYLPLCLLECCGQFNRLYKVKYLSTVCLMLKILL